MRTSSEKQGAENREQLPQSPAATAPSERGPQSGAPAAGLNPIPHRLRAEPPFRKGAKERESGGERAAEGVGPYREEERKRGQWNEEEARRVLFKLPVEPPLGMEETVMAEEPESLGGHLAIYRRESVTIEPELKQTMGPHEWQAWQDGVRHTWGARCLCTSCGGDWLSGWGPGGQVRVVQGDDGMVYSAVPAKDEAWIPFEEGSMIVCPWCCSSVQLVRKSSIRDQRTFQLMVGSVMNVEEYTAVVYWLMRRVIYADGDVTLETFPAYAAVLDGQGRLHNYSAMKSSMDGGIQPDQEGWRATGSLIEPEQTRYHSYDGWGNKKVGAIYYERVPEQGGQTGEKTGLAAYIEAGGCYPLQYLRWWKDHQEVENLVKAGWTRVIASSIWDEVDRALQYYNGDRKVHLVTELGCLFNWGCVRPCDLTRMSRAEERLARSWKWDRRMMELWMEMDDYGLVIPGAGDAQLIQDCVQRYGFDNILRWESEVTDGAEWCLGDMDRYLQRQERKNRLQPVLGFNMLLDYWGMLTEDAEEREPTPEKWWPLNLRNAHDAAARVIRETKGDKQYAEGFARVLAKWSGLEWSDGEICVRLPRSNAELRQEGRVLNHCVGRYGAEHVKECVILFVRHARRPERSWFTLNIDLRGETPREVQLHGYGNEWAHGIELHIPKRVRAFVDRWKKEVLGPVFRRVKAAEAKAEKPKRKKKEAA